MQRPSSFRPPPRGDGTASLRVPWVPPVRGSHLIADKGLLSWMQQKVQLKQDMFFIGDPGPQMRQAVLQFAAHEGREIEYVGVTRDTNEADLKQRREINDGHLCFYNSPAVEAALHGRILVLEGIEKAERNVLPLLNNLLENREMALEDGSFLMAPGREAEIAQAAEGGRKLLAVSPNFIVIAIGLPVPKYPGAPLDPPLRSRFAAKTVSAMHPTAELRLLQSLAPQAPRDVLTRLVGTVGIWRAAGDPQSAVSDASQSALLEKAPRLPRFPELGMVSVARLLELFPRCPPEVALHSAFPWTVFNLSAAERKTLDSALKAFQESWDATTSGYVLDDVRKSANNPRKAVLSLGFSGQRTVQAECPCGEWPVQLEPLQDLTPSQRRLLTGMLQDHCVGMDLCLIGERGVGKTALIRTFAQVLGYRIFTLFCFKDMSARDLTQRRSTDERGNTTWHLSSLLEAALTGGLAVLDGVHRLPSGALVGILGRLLCDRTVDLADGTHLVPWTQWERWIAVGRTEEELRGQGYFPMHPAFRVLATAEPPEQKERPWLGDEVFTLFHFTDVRPMKASEQVKLVEKQSGLQDMAPIRGLIAYMQSLRDAAQADPTLEPMMLSTRQLLHAGRHLALRPQDLRDAIRGCLSAYFRFLSPQTRATVTKRLHEAMQANGVKVDMRDLVDERAPGEGKQVAVQAVAGAVAADRMQLVETEHEVMIGDACAKKQTPVRPELVPRTHFVDIPQHVAALHAMLVDWSLGRHLLLIGNQGVGKNKLADRFLGLLRIEREYVQLHRDTTVQSLTLQPMLRGGVVVYEDSPLVCAIRHGRTLVIDEADKAPLEVVCILKSLAEDGEFTLGDGRTIIKRERVPSQLVGREEESLLLPIADNFRMIVLANRPGFPFLGNDFYRECGDVFASHAIENPDVKSEVELLRSYGPNVKEAQIVSLIGLFTELRRMVDEGVLAYPYSTRELVRIIQHLEAFPDDDVEEVFSNVFSFDWHDRKLRNMLSEVLRGFEVGMGAGRPTSVKYGDPNKMTLRDFKAVVDLDGQ